MSTVMPKASMDVRFVITNHRKAIFRGVVKQAVNTSAGNSGLSGSDSCGPQASSTMQS
eukprot:CAMPEP_0184554244 /NCGR_PEP_ID=MMETSP0199_2-20130426/34405_1 /TAXON_ID=1112570 /ORGANISM="Thraustochytrium sp., Strain LLF1b" /LENGTH=57 /DNA_ID=CAMNT_0026950209 /DNA_START=7 /DNA_END=180 /DNA_ORIENTATION=+